MALKYDEVSFGFPAYRVFIFGQEVTEDVVSITTNFKTRSRSPSDASIELLNPLDKYIVRRTDIIQMKGITGSASLADDIEAANEEVENSFKDQKSTKSRVMTIKSNSFFQETATIVDPNTGQEKGTQKVTRFPFIEGRCIFHQNDPIRIFVQDVYDPSVWYFLFSGFITLIPDTVQARSLQKTINIQAEDVTKTLRYAKMAFNPEFKNPQLFNRIFKTRGTSISYTGTKFGNLDNLHFEGIIDSLVFGDAVAGGDAPNPNDSIQIKGWGMKINQPISYHTYRSAAGLFKKQPNSSRVFTFNGVNSITLDRWQNEVIDHRVRIEDLNKLVTERITAAVERAQTLTNQLQANTSDPAFINDRIITEIGTEPFLYPVDGGTVLMLMPGTGFGELGKDIISTDFMQSLSMVSEFKDRRTILYDIVDRVDFSFYSDPKGNVVIEFPFYDFDPNDFDSLRSLNTKTALDTNNISPGIVRFTDRNASGDVQYNNTTRFTIEDAVVGDFTATDNDAPVRTVAVANPVPSRSSEALSGNNINTSPIQYTGVVLESLIPIYGVRIVQANEQKLCETEKSTRLACMLALNKINAESYTFRLSILPRMGAWINRPYLFKYRNHIALAVSVTHHITWNSSADTVINFNYARGWHGDLDENGNMVYSTIGGRESKPINWAVLLGKRITPKPQGTKGV